MIDFAAAQKRVRPAPVDWAREAEEFYRRHPEYLVARHRSLLSRLEKQLAGGVYVSGPRKGQPLDERDRATKEAEADRLRGRIARAALEPEPVA